MSKICEGDRVRWIYRHYFNSKASAFRAKIGEVIKVYPDKVKVHIEGNKKPRFCRLWDLEVITND